MTTGTNVPSIQFSAVGFIAPSPAAVLTGVQLDINAAFGNVLNYGLTTPQGQLASSWGAIIVNANSNFVNLSQQMDPAYAYGRFQDAIGRIYLLERNPAQPTALQVICIGAQGVVIPTNALINDTSGNIYQCTAGGTIDITGTITLPFAAAIPGPTPVPPTVSIYQTISGWDTASVASGVVGVNVESRAAFEARREATVAGNSFGPVGAIIGAVAKVPGVLDYYGFNNNTNAPVTINGVVIGANSIYICVAGGTPVDIATAIFSKKGAGAPMTGNTTVVVYDNNPLYASPIPYTIIYQTPSTLQILFSVTIASGVLAPSNAVQQIQSALIAAFSGNALSASFNGSISGTTLTVTNLESGAIAVGQVVTDLTGAILANTKISSLGTGVGGVGTYEVSQTQTVADEEMSATVPINTVTPPRARIGSTIYAIQYVSPIAALGSWAQVSALTIGSANTPDAVVAGHIVGNTFTCTAVTSGSLAVGQNLTDANGLIITGTYITVLGSGAGGTGTYTINNPQTVGGATFTGTGSGTNLTASVVTGTISKGDVLSGTGIPGGTKIVSQTSGTPGGAGVYVTSGATTSSGNAITANTTVNAASADQALTTVHIDQEPQLTPSNIKVTLL